MTVSARTAARQQREPKAQRIYTARITQAWAKRGASPLAAVSGGAQALWHYLANGYQESTWVRRDDGQYAMTAYPSQHTLARAMGVSEETIRRRTRALEAAGLLQIMRVAIDGTRRKRCYYTLLAPMKHSAMPARKARAKQTPRGCVRQRMENPAPTQREQRALRLVDEQREQLAEVERTLGKTEAEALRRLQATVQQRQREAGHNPQHTAVSLEDAALLVGDTLDTEQRGVPMRIESDAAPMVAEACRRIPGLQPGAAVALVRHCGLDAFAEALDMVRHMSAGKRSSIGSLAGYFTTTARNIARKGCADARA